MADTPPAQVTPPPTFGTTPPPASVNPPPEEAPKPPEQEAPPAEAPKPPETPKEPERVVPERYELKVPDGSFLDQKSVERIEAYAKAHKLTQAEASDLLKNQNDDVTAVMHERKAMWLEETKADREIGGANLQKNVETAKTFLDKHMAPELRQELDRTGYGNNRHFMKFILDMAKRSANDQAVMPGQQAASPADRSLADLFYAETTSKHKY